MMISSKGLSFIFSSELLLIFALYCGCIDGKAVIDGKAKSISARTNHKVNEVVMTATLQMLDAMQQLMTGEPEFDRDYYQKLRACQDSFHPDLTRAQDLQWQGIIDYWLMGGGIDDPWGETQNVYHENNATNTDFLNMTIYEPCNYASNVAYYHDVTEFCERLQAGQQFSWAEEYVIALGKSYSGLAVGSSFMHMSHTGLGGQQDTRSISLMSYAVLQGALSAIPDCPTILTDMTDPPRALSSLELIDDVMNMYLTMPVEEWSDHIDSLDIPDYYLTFAGIYSIAMTLAFKPDVVDHYVPILCDQFGVPDDIETFIMEIYLPELRNVTDGFDLNAIQEIQFVEDAMSSVFKIVYAFLWQEEVLTDNPIFLNETVNQWGWETLPKLNTKLNEYNTFDYYELDFQNGTNIYPGDEWCNPVGPHAKWHLQSGIGLLDITYVGDEMFRLLSTLK